MIITKIFRFEGAHIVRGCSSVRCRENIHGHSYRVEVSLSSDKLDNGFMVMDFSLLSKVKELVDSFDHSYSVWDQESDSFMKMVDSFNKRHVTMPISPSAEGYALLFFYVIDKVIQNTIFANNEGNVQLHSVKVHETETGSATCFASDLDMVFFSLTDLKFSKGVQSEWKSPQWWQDLLAHRSYVNETPKA
ncbi:6-pyruvoyl tetrahydropterin synthase family protein [Halosquirtibacter xylanolyticus]|uniref:6-pyruvoyl trahydropterin synthase family protein n=1 Tax=Halosquirtibacter xylanolyticus TaxID=3374599 RepID=UPI0037480C8E|nr:6-pyruvoyl tetrahydropterin synthase family protein [Prolixibacteraceae bacterium]